MIGFFGSRSMETRPWWQRAVAVGFVSGVITAFLGLALLLIGLVIFGLYQVVPKYPIISFAVAILLAAFYFIWDETDGGRVW